MAWNESESDSESKEMRCEKCGYEWEYSGELWYTTCPRHNGKTKTWRHPDNQETDE